MSRSYRRTNNANLKGVFIIALGVVIVAGMFVLARSSKAALGPDLCPAAGPSGLLVLIVDATDHLSEAQKLDVKNRLQRQIVEVAVGWRVEVWNIAPGAGVPAVIGVPLCRPARAVDVSSLTANPRLAEERYSQFTQSVTRMLEDVLSRPDSSGSPILESLQAVGLRSFGSPALIKETPKRLVLVSDLIQNTDRLSFLHGIPPYDDFQGSRAFDALRAPISGVQVEVMLLARSGGLAPSQLVTWWQEYFVSMGATLVSVQRIVG